MTTTICSVCNKELEIGDYPFCPHGSIYEARARRFDPIVVHRNIETGEYSFPGHSADTVSEGYEKIEITNLRQADALCREMENKELAKRHLNITAEKQYWDQRTKARREMIESEMRKHGITHSKIYDMLKQYRDKQREKKYDRLMKRPVNFNINVFSFDSSNRNSYSGPETNWKERKA